MVGVTTVGLFIVWLTATLGFRPRPATVILVENVPGRGDHAEGFERDLEAPGMEEMPELAEPQLEATMEAMTDAVAPAATDHTEPRAWPSAVDVDRRQQNPVSCGLKTCACQA